MPLDFGAVAKYFWTSFGLVETNGPVSWHPNTIRLFLTFIRKWIDPLSVRPTEWLSNDNTARSNKTSSHSISKGTSGSISMVMGTFLGRESTNLFRLCTNFGISVTSGPSMFSILPKQESVWNSVPREISLTCSLNLSRRSTIIFIAFAANSVRISSSKSINPWIRGLTSKTQRAPSLNPSGETNGAPA